MKSMSTLTIILLFLQVLSVTAKEMNDSSSLTSSSSSSSATKPAAVAATQKTATAATTTPIITEEGAILVIGDSWASLSGNYAANICGSSSPTRPIQNGAKSGSTAKAWAYKRLGVESIENARYEYTHVWLSIGGNDFLDNNCDMSIADEVAANVVNVIKQVVDASQGVAGVDEVAFQNKEDIKILYFGYSIPSQDVCGQGRTATLFAEQGNIIFDAIQNSDYAEYVTTFDISNMFVTSESSPLSDPSYFVDAVHLNEEGYTRLFSGYQVLRFFDCSVVQIAQMAAFNQAADYNNGQLPIGIIAGSAVAIVSVMVLACFWLKKKR